MHGLSVYQMTGLAPIETNSVAAAHPLQSGADADYPMGLRGLIHPDNPLTWLLAIGAVTLGLVGVSGSVRVGKAKASATLDKT